MTMQFEYKSHALSWIVDNMGSLNKLSNREELLGVVSVLGQDYNRAVGIITQNDSEQAVKKLLQMQGEIGLAEGAPYFTYLAFNQLDDREGLIKTFEMAIENGWMCDAQQAYRKINTKEHLKKFIEVLSEKEKSIRWGLDEVIESFIGKEIKEDFEKYCRSRRVKPRTYFSKCDTINAAYNLSPDYDVAVGIARGGLFSSHIFHLMGLPVVLCEAHRRGRGATFKWHHSPKRLKNKKVLVLDKDCVSGRTLRRTVREILPYSPTDLGVFFNHNPPYLNLNTVPEEFTQINFPKTMNYNNIYKAIEKCHEALSKRK